MKLKIFNFCYQRENCNLVLKQRIFSEVKQEIRRVNKEMKFIYRKSNEISKYKYKRIQNAFWLSSFIGLFMPCCYTKPLELSTLSIIGNEQKLLEKLGTLETLMTTEQSKIFFRPGEGKLQKKSNQITGDWCTLC